MTFENFTNITFALTTLKVTVDPVEGEQNTDNNTADYPVIFSSSASLGAPVVAPWPAGSPSVPLPWPWWRSVVAVAAWSALRRCGVPRRL